MKTGAVDMAFEFSADRRAFATPVLCAVTGMSQADVSVRRTRGIFEGGEVEPGGRERRYSLAEIARLAGQHELIGLGVPGRDTVDAGWKIEAYVRQAYSKATSAREELYLCVIPATGAPPARCYSRRGVDKLVSLLQEKGAMAVLPLNGLLHRTLLSLHRVLKEEREVIAALDELRKQIQSQTPRVDNTMGKTR